MLECLYYQISVRNRISKLSLLQLACMIFLPQKFPSIMRILTLHGPAVREFLVYSGIHDEPSRKSHRFCRFIRTLLVNTFSPQKTFHHRSTRSGSVRFRRTYTHSAATRSLWRLFLGTVLLRHRGFHIKCFHKILYFGNNFRYFLTCIFAL